jgi:glycosyltransferase involved in cell wall biosynthesis
MLDQTYKTERAPMVSVVMSVYNGERHLRESIESILRQSFCDFEFIIIDDASTDGSPEIVKHYQNVDQRIRVFRQRHRLYNEADTYRLGEALNQGCALARGKYIARMDADDIAVSHRLSLQVDFMEQHPAVGLVGGAVEWFDTDRGSLGVYRNPTDDHQIRKRLFKTNSFWHPTAFFRKDVFLSSGGYRSIVASEDYDLWLRMADRFRLANLDDVVLHYRVHPQQVSVRKRRQQTYSSVAVRAAALARNGMKREPFSPAGDVKPSNLLPFLPDILHARGSETVSRETVLDIHLARCLEWISDYLAAIAEESAEDAVIESKRMPQWLEVVSVLDAVLPKWLGSRPAADRFVSKLQEYEGHLQDAKKLYLLAIKRDPWSVKLHIKLMLLISGRQGKYFRRILRFFRPQNRLVQLADKCE